jgi:hypothetical protein
MMIQSTVNIQGKLAAVCDWVDLTALHSAADMANCGLPSLALRQLSQKFCDK